MAFKHPLDPPLQWSAAASAGKLVAQGILAVEDILPDLIEASINAGYRGHRHGLRARLTWQLRETAEYWRRERDQIDVYIRRELAPMFDALAPALDIIRAAHAINEQSNEPLLRPEVVTVIETEMGRRIAAFNRQSQTRGRRNAR
jgi:hypothetical protein